MTFPVKNDIGRRHILILRCSFAVGIKVFRLKAVKKFFESKKIESNQRENPNFRHVVEVIDFK